jgi:hypothetical protein
LLDVYDNRVYLGENENLIIIVTIESDTASTIGEIQKALINGVVHFSGIRYV